MRNLDHLNNTFVHFVYLIIMAQKNIALILVVLLYALLACQNKPAQKAMPLEKSQAVHTSEWTTLFDGKSLDGWKVSENPNSIRVENGAIVVHGPRAHAYYDGEIANHDFRNFEFQAEVMTTPGSNSGIYFHTAYQDTGWPEKGYEVQVNNSQEDWRRTGSLYNILDVKETYVEDNEWYTEYIKVEGKRVIVKINDLVVVDYTEPATPLRDEGSLRMIGSGTFALQAHDPGSKVYFKDIKVRGY